MSHYEFVKLISNVAFVFNSDLNQVGLINQVSRAHVNNRSSVDQKLSRNSKLVLVKTNYFENQNTYSPTRKYSFSVVVNLREYLMKSRFRFSNACRSDGSEA